MTTTNHAFQIERLRKDFENIITLKREIAKIKTVVTDKLSQLKTVYNELIKINTKKIFMFCLDSFYFQYKIFAMEMENIDNFRILMNNRMYCDFYKLYNIIIQRIKTHNEEMKKTQTDNVNSLNIDDLELKTYPAYKDLEPFHEYKLEDIKDIHNNIMVLINRLFDQCALKDDDIDHYNENHRVGFSISNFLNTLEYENRLLREQIVLYMNYMSFFHISQRKQLNRLYTRMNDFYKEVDDNININRTFSIDDIVEQDRLHRFYIIGEDVEIETLLEDTEFLMENTDKVINKVIDKVDELIEGQEQKLLLQPNNIEIEINTPPENIVR
jgi:hypothetical protein